MKAVFWLGIMVLMQISPLSFKQSRMSMLMSHSYVRKTLFTFVPECSKNIVYVRSRTFERH